MTQEEINQEAAENIARSEAAYEEGLQVAMKAQELIDQEARELIARSQEAHDEDVIEIAAPVPVTISEEDEKKFQESDALLAAEIAQNQAAIDAEAERLISGAN